MGFYADRIFPWVLEKTMNTPANRVVRGRVCAPLAGDVVEVGFGCGHNLPYLPDAVTSLRAVDPLERGRELAASRIAASPVPVTFVGLDGQRLPLDDESVDTVLCTWTLCSVPDAVAAVGEMRRVLRPGGQLHFVEHGRAPDEKVRRWQRRFEPVQRRVGCGCSLLKQIDDVVVGGGLRVDRLSTYYLQGVPKIFGWTFEGVATKAR